MARSRIPKDPTYAAIDEMLNQADLNATTQRDVEDLVQMFAQAFIAKKAKADSVQVSKRGVGHPTSVKGYGLKAPMDNIGFDNEILNLYLRGLSTSDIQSYLHETFRQRESASHIRNVIKALVPRIHTWQQRPLQSFYPVVYFDAMNFRIQGQQGAATYHTLYLALGVHAKGVKEVLGFWIKPYDDPNAWFLILESLKFRGLQDSLIAVADEFDNLSVALKESYPQTDPQMSIVHLLRQSFTALTPQHRAKLANALKPIYQAETLNDASNALQAFQASPLGQQYDRVARLWSDTLPCLSSYYAYSQPIRKLIDTPNPIDKLSVGLRKALKANAPFKSVEDVQKQVWFSIYQVEKGWKRPASQYLSALKALKAGYEARFK